MAINIIFNPVFALLLFMTGIWMGSMIHPLYGLLSIIGGLLLGSYNFFKNDEAMKKRFEENLHEILRGAVQGNIPYHPIFLKYTPMDWYFLLRVMIFELNDGDGSGIYNSSKIYSILKIYQEEET